MTDTNDLDAKIAQLKELGAQAEAIERSRTMRWDACAMLLKYIVHKLNFEQDAAVKILIEAIDGKTTWDEWIVFWERVSAQTKANAAAAKDVTHSAGAPDDEGGS